MSNESFKDQPGPEDPIWTYQGYRLKPSEFVAAMAHQFRAEIQRANVWRTRLDATTNWAVVVTSASISIAFSQPNIHHGIIILDALLITIFLFIEARRYRYYELWSYRARLIETDFFAPMLVPPFHSSPQWAEKLSENLLSFTFPISMWEAIGLRLRRNYLWIFFITSIAWLAKYWLFPSPPPNLSDFIRRAAIGPVPGLIVVSLSIVYFGFLALVAIFTLGTTHAPRDVLPHLNADTMKSMYSSGKTKKRRAWLGLHHQRQQLLAIIITEKPDAVANRVLSEVGRGVTAVPGKGNTMLMCALTTNEITNLKVAVAKEDPQAFVNALFAQEVLGRGFDPLSEE